MYTAPLENMFILGHFSITNSVEDENLKAQFVRRSLQGLINDEVAHILVSPEISAHWYDYIRRRIDGSRTKRWEHEQKKREFGMQNRLGFHDNLSIKPCKFSTTNCTSGFWMVSQDEDVHQGCRIYFAYNSKKIS